MAEGTLEGIRPIIEPKIPQGVSRFISSAREWFGGRTSKPAEPLQNIQDIEQTSHIPSDLSRITESVQPDLEQTVMSAPTMQTGAAEVVKFEEKDLGLQLWEKLETVNQFAKKINMESNLELSQEPSRLIRIQKQWLDSLEDRLTELSSRLESDQRPSGIVANEIRALKSIIDSASPLIKDIRKARGFERKGKILNSAKAEKVETGQEITSGNFIYEDGAWVLEEAGENAIDAERPFGFMEYRGVLPLNCLSWESTDINAEIKGDKVPALNPNSKYRIKLDRLRFNIESGEEDHRGVYLGVLIPEKEGIEHLQISLGYSAKQKSEKITLTQDELTSYEKLAFQGIGDFLEGKMRKRLDTANEDAWPVYTCSNGRGGRRIYFIDAGRIYDKRIIIVVEAISKTAQEKFFDKAAKW